MRMHARTLRRRARRKLRRVAQPMLHTVRMKRLALFLSIALAAPAFAGPDFNSRSPRAHSLAASSGSSEIGPLDDVVFAHDSAQLTDVDIAQIETAARWLRQHGMQRVVLEGYADSTGVSAYNEDLATRRAFAVRQQLIGRGIDADRIIMVTYGEANAISGPNPLDRRVVMYATKLAPQQIATASLERKNALSVAWSQDRAMFNERRRGTVISTR
jgi:outer membrane protein OmpA-like peptidoglycan-associated protein